MPETSKPFKDYNGPETEQLGRADTRDMISHIQTKICNLLDDLGVTLKVPSTSSTLKDACFAGIFCEAEFPCRELEFFSILRRYLGVSENDTLVDELSGKFQGLEQTTFIEGLIGFFIQDQLLKLIRNEKMPAWMEHDIRSGRYSISLDQLC